MARDIEEFLRRAAERRKQNQGQAAPKPPPAPEPPPVAAPRSRRRLADEGNDRSSQQELDPYRELPRSREAGQSQATPRPKAPPVAGQGKSRRESQGSRRETIAEHVRDAIVVSDVTESASQLGKEVGLADEKLEARLEKFDHKIGDLEGMSSIQDDRVELKGPDKSHIAVSLLELLKQPQTVQQSILISEILKRPNFDD